MRGNDDSLDAIVLAGGRISGEYAREAKTTIKALVKIGGKPVIERVVDALRQAPGVDRICLVGPVEVRDAIKAVDLWTHDEGSAINNIQTGIESLGSTSRRVLVVASDMPFVTAKGIDHFIRHSPINAEISIPIVAENDYMKAYPDTVNEFVKLARGGVTIGGMAIVDCRIITANLALIDRVFSRRKSQAGMAMTLGFGFVMKLLTGKLTIQDVEKRASELTECRCTATTGSSPRLAYDIDTLADYRDACKRAAHNAKVEAHNAAVKAQTTTGQGTAASTSS